MFATLTKSRSASYHHRSMLKIVVIGVCLYALWEPIRPLRQITADILNNSAELIRQ